MNSQEEFMGCLWQLTEALAPNRVCRLSIVRDGDADVVEGERREPRRARALERPHRKTERAPVREPEPL
jgi:hypothetical protein